MRTWGTERLNSMSPKHIANWWKIWSGIQISQVPTSYCFLHLGASISKEWKDSVQSGHSHPTPCLNTIKDDSITFTVLWAGDEEFPARWASLCGSSTQLGLDWDRYTHVIQAQTCVRYPDKLKLELRLNHGVQGWPRGNAPPLPHACVALRIVKGFCLLHPTHHDSSDFRLDSALC